MSSRERRNRVENIYIKVPNDKVGGSQSVDKILKPGAREGAGGGINVDNREPLSTEPETDSQVFKVTRGDGRKGQTLGSNGGPYGSQETTATKSKSVGAKNMPTRHIERNMRLQERFLQAENICLKKERGSKPVTFGTNATAVPLDEMGSHRSKRKRGKREKRNPRKRRTDNRQRKSYLGCAERRLLTMSYMEEAKEASSSSVSISFSSAGGRGTIEEVRRGKGTQGVEADRGVEGESSGKTAGEEAGNDNGLEGGVTASFGSFRFRGAITSHGGLLIKAVRVAFRDSNIDRQVFN